MDGGAAGFLSVTPYLTDIVESIEDIRDEKSNQGEHLSNELNTFVAGVRTAYRSVP
jgi:hypothetical protein